MIPAGLRALRHRDFRLFWTGQLVSLIGTWMQSVGQSWLVLQLTDSPLKLGLINMLQFAPILLLSFVAGVLADRAPRRRLLIATQSALLLQSLTLSALIATGHVRFWHVAVLATLLGLVNTLDMPVRQVFVIEMVGKDDLGNAIALNSAIFNGARVIGPAVAGLLIARWGIATAFLLNGLSFLAVIAALLVIDAEGPPRPRTGATMLDEIREGLGYAVRTPRIAFVLGLVLGVSLFAFNYNVMIPLLARDVLHQEAQGFGFLMAIYGTGALAGAVVLAAIGSVRPRLSTIAVAAALVCAATAAMTVVRHVGLAAAILFVIGLAGIVFMASSNTTLQLTAPDALRGRMMSLYTFVFAGVTPLGSLLIGAVAEAFGVPAAFMAAGGLGLGSVLIVVGIDARHRARRGLPGDEVRP